MIKNNFWQKLTKPFFVLAPMDEVTDVVFREIVAKTAKPDVFFTEFTNVDGLMSHGKAKLMPRFDYTEEQRYIVAQIWGKTPENYEKIARMLVKMGFDGIDINMGCPDRKITKNGCCAAFINNPTLASQVIKATKKGAAGKIPVSVKTRIGFSKVQTDEWIEFLLKQDIPVLTVHGRLAKDMSKYPADWSEIKKAVEIRNKLGVDTLIVGNGDVLNREDGLKKAQESGVDGLMIGRGIFKDIQTFADKSKVKTLTLDQSLKLLLDHMRLFDKTWGKTKNFNIMKKFFKVYVQNFERASDLRAKLMEAKSPQEVEIIIKNYNLPAS